jgi:para-aminobenzoate synthetase component 2
VLLLDNHDSFTWNLAQYLEELGAPTDVVLSDSIGVDAILERGEWAGVLLGPGPGGPEEAGITVELLRRSVGRLPIFGVCLGMQCMAVAHGGRVVRSREVVHGKTSPVLHDGIGVFRGLASPMTATRYHSLVVDPGKVPSGFRVHARTADGTIMGMRHVRMPLEGVQFHPESILTVDGKALLSNWLRAVDRLVATVDP